MGHRHDDGPSPLPSPGMLEVRAVAPDDLSTRFRVLTSFLLAHEELWRDAPFVHTTLRWEARYPEVGAWARSLDAATVDRYEHHLDRIVDPPRAFRGWQQEAEAVASLEELPRDTLPSPAPPLDTRGIKARKLAQMEAFLGCVTRHLGPHDRIADWCAGKGHLGRSLATTVGVSVVAVERDGTLCADGRAMAEEAGLGVRFEQLDVLRDPLDGVFRDTTAAVALHACGRLHTTLLDEVATRGIDLVALAPCCYAKRGHRDPYLPRSRRGRAAGLLLEHRDVAMCTTDELVASRGRARARLQERAWRLAFDALVRRTTGATSYTPLRAFPRALLSLPFGEWCHRMAGTMGLELSSFDPDELEAWGWARSTEVRALALVRALFRRPLEVWIAMDLALSMEEQGYETTLGSFCDRESSPRNILLIARRTRTR